MGLLRAVLQEDSVHLIWGSEIDTFFSYDLKTRYFEYSYNFVPSNVKTEAFPLFSSPLVEKILGELVSRWGTRQSMLGSVMSVETA